MFGAGLCPALAVKPTSKPKPFNRQRLDVVRQQTSLARFTFQVDHVIGDDTTEIDTGFFTRLFYLFSLPIRNNQFNFN